MYVVSTTVLDIIYVNDSLFIKANRSDFFKIKNSLTKKIPDDHKKLTSIFSNEGRVVYFEIQHSSIKRCNILLRRVNG